MKKSIKFFITALTMLLVINILSINIRVFASEDGEITADNVNFRQKASSTSDIIQSLKKGAKLTIEGEEQDFYKVRYNSIEGYVSKQFVKINSNNENDKSSETTNADNTDNTDKSDNISNDNSSNDTKNADSTDNSTTSVNVNDELTEEEAINKNKTKIKNESTLYVLPLLNSSKIGKVEKDEEVTLISINGKWAYIRNSNKSGWINKECIESQQIYLPNNTQSNANDTNNTSNTNSENNSQNTTTVNENLENNTSNNDNTDSNVSDSEENNKENQDNSENKNSEKIMYVNVDAVNLRKEPSTSSTIVNSLEKNDEVKVTDASNSEWYKVSTSSNLSGYVLAKYLSDTKQ